MIWTDGLKSLYQGVANKSPRKGAQVWVTGGRKHKNKEGKVFWHGRDTFDRFPHRYHDSYQAQMSDCMGTYGFRVGIQTEDGEKFFVPGEQVTVLISCEGTEVINASPWPKIGR